MIHTAQRSDTPVDSSVVMIEGPWRHHYISAGGARFHAVTMEPEDGSVRTGGEGTETEAPLVVLLHGFPQFWWAWRHQLTALADAGYRAVAIDLRGFGASDKPPEDRTIPRLVADVEAVIRALGSGPAVVVGAGIGGAVAWSMPVMAPESTRAICAVAAPHPSVPRRGQFFGPGVRAAIVTLRMPGVGERRLLQDNGAVALMRAWGADPSWLSPSAARRYRDAIRIPFVASSALDYVRWLAQGPRHVSQRRWYLKLGMPINVPVLQIHGSRDHCLDLRGAVAPRIRSRRYEFMTITGGGHYLAEETPGELSSALVSWLGSI